MPRTGDRQVSKHTARGDHAVHLLDVKPWKGPPPMSPCCRQAGEPMDGEWLGWWQCPGGDAHQCGLLWIP